jgi:hypothetical protein
LLRSQRLIAPALFYRFTLQLVRDQSVALERGKNA